MSRRFVVVPHNAWTFACRGGGHSPGPALDPGTSSCASPTAYASPAACADSGNSVDNWMPDSRGRTFAALGRMMNDDAVVVMRFSKSPTPTTEPNQHRGNQFLRRRIRCAFS